MGIYIMRSGWVLFLLGLLYLAIQLVISYYFGASSYSKYQGE